jgi:hypothetical protein
MVSVWLLLASWGLEVLPLPQQTLVLVVLLHLGCRPVCGCNRVVLIVHLPAGLLFL